MFVDLVTRLHTIWAWLTRPSPQITDADTRRKSQLLAAIIVLLAPIGMLVRLIIIVHPDAAALFGPASASTAPLLSVIGIGLYWLNRQGHVTLAIRITIAVVALSTFMDYLIFEHIFGASPLYRLVVAIIVSSFFLSIRDMAVYAVLLVVATLMLPAIAPGITMTDVVPQPLMLLLTVAILTLLITRYRDQLETDRQANLRQTESRYRQIIQATFDTILVHQDGRVLEADSAVTAVFGYRASEIVGMQLRQLLPDSEESATGHLHVVEVTRKDGSTFFAEIVTIEQHQGTDIQVTAVRNVSRTQRVEQALRESERRFRMVTESSPDFVYIWQAGSDRVPYFNRDGFLGYTREELVTPGYLASHVHPDDWTRLQTHWQSILNDSHNGKEPFVEYRIRHKQGHWEWVERRETVIERNISHQPEQVLITLRVISERKHIEEELRFQASIFQNVSDAIIVTDRDFRIQSWNPAAERIYGWQPHEVIGREFEDVVQPSFDLPPGKRAVTLTDGYEKGYWKAEATHKRKDGSLMDALVSATLIKDQSGDVMASVNIVHDNTERKQAEAELRRREAHSQALIDAIPDLIIQIDRDGNYLEVWPPKTPLNYTPIIPAEELPGKNILEVLPHEVALSVLERVRKALATGEMQRNEYQINEPEAPRYYEARWVAYADKEVFGLIRDITERKRDEEQLRQQAQIFQSAAEAIILTNLVDDVYYIQSWNQAAERMYGWKAEEVIGKTYAEVIRPEYPEGMPRSEVLRILRTEGYWSGEIYHYDKQGNRMDVLISASMLQTGPSQPASAMIIVLDVTRRKQAEAALHMSEERFRTALKGAPVVVSNQDTDLRYTWIHSPAHNFNASEVIGKQDRDILEDSESAAQLEALKRQVLESGSGMRREVRIHQKGADHHYDLTIEPLKNQAGAVVGITCAQIDITERVQTEDARLRIQRLLQTVVSNVPIVVWAIDAQGIVTLSDGLGLRALNLEPGNSVGRSAFEVYQNESEVIALIHRALSGEAVNGTYTLGGVTMESHLQPIFNPMGKVDGVVGVTLDISERKRAEQQELDLALERERILMLRRFMGDVSHDFKTPLSSIKLSAYMLGKVEDEQDQARHLQVIEMQTVRLEKLMADLFTMSRLDMSETQEFNFGRVDINTLLSNVIIAHEPVIQQRQHTLTFEPNESMRSVWADRFQLDRVFTNLLINAAHYTPNGGKISIRTIQGENEAIVEVEDNGVGIAPEAQSLVFTRFYRADPSRNPNLGGTGVGLAIARKIVETHGGQIEVESKPGKGSTFTVRLPQLATTTFGSQT